MEAFKFETTVLENGMIQIPEVYKFQNKKVRIYIETVQEKTTEEDKKIELLNDFFEKWGGFFSTDEDSTDDRYNYLMEKYK